MLATVSPPSMTSQCDAGLSALVITPQTALYSFIPLQDTLNCSIVDYKIPNNLILNSHHRKTQRFPNVNDGDCIGLGLVGFIPVLASCRK